MLGHRLVELQAPTGSGKTQAAVVWALTSHRRKIIIVTSQNAIKLGFARGFEMDVGGRTGIVQWTGFAVRNGRVQHHGVDDVKRLASRRGLDSHESLIVTQQVFAALTNERVNFKEFAIIVDEAHHSGQSVVELDRRTQLSRAIERAAQAGAAVLLTSATLSRTRSDESIAPVALRGQFEQFHHSYAARLRETGLRQTMNLYGGEPMSFQQHMLDVLEDGRNTIIFLPPSGSTLDGYYGGKNAQVELFRARWPDLIDVVTDGPKHRARELKRLLEMTSSSNSIPPILAMKMLREGYDNSLLRRAVLIKGDPPMTDIIQCNGRLLRQHPGKHSVETFAFVPIGKNGNIPPKPEECKEYFEAMVSMLTLTAVGQDQPLDDLTRGPMRQPSVVGKSMRSIAKLCDEIKPLARSAIQRSMMHDGRVNIDKFAREIKKVSEKYNVFSRLAQLERVVAPIMTTTFHSSSPDMLKPGPNSLRGIPRVQYFRRSNGTYGIR